VARSRAGSTAPTADPGGVAGLSATPACGCGGWDDVVPHLTVAEQRLADLLTHSRGRAGCAVGLPLAAREGPTYRRIHAANSWVANELARLLALASNAITLSVQVVGVGTRDADGSMSVLRSVP
jgi:hypothetical protein